MTQNYYSPTDINITRKQTKNEGYELGTQSIRRLKIITAPLTLI